MNTLELNAAIGLTEEEEGEETITKPGSFYTKLIAAIDNQEDKRTGWFITSLLAQGVLFLPVPAVLIYYCGAPIWVLMVTTLLFFANLIAGMGGLKARVLIALLAAGVVVHLAMILAFAL